MLAVEGLAISSGDTASVGVGGLTLGGGNALMPTLTDALIDHLISFQESRPSATIFLRSLGGAAGDVPVEATGFSARSATWLVMMGAFDTGFDDAERADVTAACAALNADGALVYGNFSSDTGPAAANGMYAHATAARLREIKQRWDPTNIFCRAHVFV